MKRHWICLQLRRDALQDVKLEMLSRRAALVAILYFSYILYIWSVTVKFYCYYGQMLEGLN